MHPAAVRVLQVLRDLGRDQALAVYNIDLVNDLEAPLESALKEWFDDGAPLPGDQADVVHFIGRDGLGRCSKNVTEGTEVWQDVTCKRCRQLLKQDAERAVKEITEVLRRRIQGLRLTKALLQWKPYSREELEDLRRSWRDFLSELEMTP